MEPPAPQSQPTSSNVPTPPVANTPPTAASSAAGLPKKSWLRRYWVLILVIAAPILYLVYRLGIGVLYSPQAAYTRNKDKIATQSKKATQDVSSKQDEIFNQLSSIAPTLEADTPQPNGQQLVRDPATGKMVVSTIMDLPNQKEAKGTITRVDGQGEKNLCAAFTKTAGSKFNEHTVGQQAYCWDVITRIYVWTGSNEKLDQMLKIMEGNLKLSSNKYGIDLASINSLQMTTSTDAVSTASNHDYNDNYGDYYTWDQSFISTDAPVIQPSPNKEEDKRYMLRVDVIDKYYQLYDINY